MSDDPASPHGPTACAEGSHRRMTDEIPDGNTAFAAFMPCEYCGHPGCFPGRQCIHCTVEIRLQKLEGPHGEQPPDFPELRVRMDEDSFQTALRWQRLMREFQDSWNRWSSSL